MIVYMENPQIEQVAQKNKWHLILIPVSFSLLSLVYLFGAHYRSHTSEGHSILFDLNSGNYITYAIFFAIISFLLYKYPNKAVRVLLTIGLVFYVVKNIPLFLWAGPLALIAGWPLLAGYIAISLVLYGVLKIINFSIEKRSNFVPICLLVVSLIIGGIAGYVNINDLGVKGHIVYKNNSMFDTIEECSAYIFPTRKNDCEKDFTDMHNRWFLQENSNLVPKQNLSPGSSNYAYFPQENISDVKVGTGELAKYNDTVVLNILTANINGKTYTDLESRHIISDNDPYKNTEIKLDTSVESYNSYALGVIGMKVGGVRKITFNTKQGFWFTGVDPMFVVNPSDSIIYTVELLSVK